MNKLTVLEQMLAEEKEPEIRDCIIKLIWQCKKNNADEAIENGESALKMMEKYK